MRMLLFAIIVGSYQWMTVQTSSAPVAAAAITNDTYAIVQTTSPMAKFVVFNRPFVDIIAIDPTAPIRYAVVPDLKTAAKQYDTISGGTDKGIVTVATGQTILWFTRDSTANFCSLPQFSCSP